MSEPIDRSNWLRVNDFDRSMFRTDDYAERVIERTQQEGFLNFDHMTSMIEAMRGAEESFDIAQAMQARGVNLEQIIDELGIDGREFLYDDVSDYVRRNPEFHIVTTGVNRILQMAKVRSAGFGDRVTVLTEKKGPFIRDETMRTSDGVIFPPHHESRNFDGITVIDDRLAVVDNLVGEPHHEVVVIHRPDSKYPPPDVLPEGVLVIESLDEI